MATSLFTRLPAGHHEHPPDCLCRAHERGEWAGYDPRSGEVAELGSVREYFMRQEIEDEIGARFRRRLGRVDWQRARLIHETHVCARRRRAAAAR
jgi:hypothetical protein